jgi:Flp pilus assembly protein TadD
MIAERRAPWLAASALWLAACGHAPRRSCAARRGRAGSRRPDRGRARRHDLARQHHERAIALAATADDVVYARHEYAETLVSWGEMILARAQLERAVDAQPGDPGAWHDLGLLRHDAGDDPGAIAALTRAEQLAPDDVRPRTALAALYWRRGDKTSAAREYRAMLALDLPDRLRAKVEWALAELAKP